MRSQPHAGSNSVGNVTIARCDTARQTRLDAETENFVTHSLRADGFDASEDGTGSGLLRSEVGVSAVRRLTPRKRECEKLQGFQDDHTLVPYRGKSAADGPRYKALGNSMAVPVMAWIGERIDRVEQMEAA